MACSASNGAADADADADTADRGTTEVAVRREDLLMVR